MGKSPPPKSGYGEIDESLRRAFEEVLNEGVPDRFSQLLEQLKSGEVPPTSKDEEKG